MMDFITVPLIVGIIFFTIYGLFELFVRRKERLAIIEKMGDQLEFSQIANNYLLKFGMPSISFNALKIGCLLMGIGLGLIVGVILHLYAETQIQAVHKKSLLGTIYGAPVLLFGGFGLIIAFVIEMKIGNRKDK